MVYGVPEQSVEAMAERAPMVPEREHPRALKKLADLAKRKEGKQASQNKPGAQSTKIDVAPSTKIDIAPSKDKFCWADDEPL